MNFIIGLIIKELVTMAIQFGLPYVTAWLQQHAPWLPIAEIIAIIQKLIGQLTAHAEAHPEKGPAYQAKVAGSVAVAKHELGKVCSGVACPADLVGNH